MLARNAFGALCVWLLISACGKDPEKLQAREQAALSETGLLLPTDYHWLLLYEVLEVYSEGFNDMPHGRLCERFGIEHIDFHLLIEMFFWDNDFLGEEIPDLALETRQRLDISPETFGLTVGMKPHPEELALKVCEAEMVKEWEHRLFAGIDDLPILF